MRISLFLCILSLMLAIASGMKLLPFVTISGKTPGNTYDIGNLKSTDVIRITVTQSQASTKGFLYKKESGTFTRIENLPDEVTTVGNQIIVQKLAGFDTQFYVVVESTLSNFRQYKVEVLVNGALVVSQNGIVQLSSHGPAYFITTQKSCKARIKFSGPTGSMYGLASESSLLGYSVTKQL